jgi:hypothetical protein
LLVRVRPVKRTCKHGEIDPFIYLRDLLLRLPSQPADQLEELVVDVWFYLGLLGATEDGGVMGRSGPRS